MSTISSIRIPVGSPLTFGALKELNPEQTNEQLADVFGRLPVEMREEALSAMRLRVALELWNHEAEGEP